MKTVKNISGSDASLYKNYIESTANTLLFQSSEYIQLLTHFLACRDETLVCLGSDPQEITGALPLLSCSGKYGRVYNSLPFFGSNGGILSTDQDSQDLLFREFERIAGQDDTATIMLSENPLSPMHLPVSFFDVIEERLCQISDIHFESNHSEMLLNQFHYKTRNMVRKGLKTGLEISIDNTAWPFLFLTHKENMSAIGAASKPQTFFDAIPLFFQQDKDYKIYTAKYKGEMVAALLLFYFKDTVEYYTPVIKNQFRSLQPNSSLIFQAMTEASMAGYKRWNWGGTGKNLTDLYRFKSRWGSKDYMYKYYIKINNKEILHSSPQELMKEYPFFYCVPFNILTN